jgi:hypothetical protein
MTQALSVTAAPSCRPVFSGSRGLFTPKSYAFLEWLLARSDRLRGDRRGQAQKFARSSDGLGAIAAGEQAVNFGRLCVRIVQAGSIPFDLRIAMPRADVRNSSRAFAAPRSFAFAGTAAA